MNRGKKAIGPENRNWKAHWIWVRENGQAPNQWVCFRKKFVLTHVPPSVMARIAVDSKYWLWINGRLAVLEGGLKRGPSRSDTYYDEVEISKHLRPGENLVCALVWFWGRHSFTHNSSGHGGFLFESEIGETSLVSGTDWAALSHPAYGHTDAPHPNWRYSEHNIRYDAAREISEWQEDDYDDREWPRPESLGTPPCSPWNELWKRPIPQWKDFGRAGYMNAPAFPIASPGEPLKLKLPYNAQITPYLRVEATAGQTITIATDHYDDPVYDPTGDDRRSLRTEYVTRDGVQDFESPAWISGHHVEYSIPAGITIHSLQYRETGYNSDFSGSFVCDSDSINRLLEKSRRTLYVCMRDYYMDCPDRERAQWGDFSMQAHQCFYALDRRSHALARKAYREILHWQMADSAIRVPVPNGLPAHNYELPVQGLYVIGRYGLGMYYRHTGDLELLIEAYPHIRAYLNLWQMRPDGLIAHRKGTWDWSDWGENIDAEILQNIWYYLALETALHIAEETGNSADAAKYRGRMESIRNRFDRAFWKGGHYSSDSTIDDRANAMAVISGLADRSKWESIGATLQDTEYASPFMEKFVLEALFVMGRSKQALDRMERRFAEMVSDPSTTLREHWSTVGGTINHGWSGGALILMPQFVAGVEPISPGYAQYRVMPQTAGLQSVDSKIETVRGNISVSIRTEKESFRLELESPSQTQATVGIPKRTPTASIRVGGSKLIENGVVIGRIAGLDHVSENSDYYKFQVAPGRWIFEANQNETREARRERVGNTAAA